MNALAAVALALTAGCPLGPMLYGLREYRGEPHRVEPVGIVNEVEYFDDSKGTNVGATVAALQQQGHDVVRLVRRPEQVAGTARLAARPDAHVRTHERFGPMAATLPGRIAAGVVLAAADGADDNPPKTLRYAFPVAETGFDPSKISDLYSRICTAHMFEGLFCYDHLARPARVVPRLADGMPEHNADFTVWRADLQLPSAEEMTNEHLYEAMTDDKIESLARFYAITAASRAALLSDLRFSMLAVADAHALMTPQGEELFISTNLEGRKRNAVLLLDFQSAGMVKRHVTEHMPIRFAGRIPMDR